MKYKTIVIGSSTGIGLAITKKLLDRNHKVTGVSRRGLSLDNESYNHLKLDVSDKDFIFKIKNEIALKEYNNLIYCVGINNIKLAKECSQEDLENIFKVNLIPALLISFEFDDFNNDSRIRFNLKQQLYGPLTFGFEGSYNINNNSSSYGDIQNITYSLGVNRRAYSINLSYDEDNKAVFLGFKVFNFDFQKSNKSF